MGYKTVIRIFGENIPFLGDLGKGSLGLSSRKYKDFLVEYIPMGSMAACLSQYRDISSQLSSGLMTVFQSHLVPTERLLAGWPT